MLKMVMRNIAASSSSYCTSRRWRGMPCLHSNSTVVVFASDYFAFLHSQPSKPIKSTRTQLEQPVRNSPKITTVEDAFNVFDRMLQMRPPPSVVRFNQILGQVAKLKHYSAVIWLYNQMGASGIGPSVCTLTILINCYCHLNQMGFSLSVLGKFFKVCLEPDVFTFNTLINDFLSENRVVEASGIFNKMIAGGNCQPNVVTYGTLVKGFCMKEMMCKGIAPDVITYNSVMNGVCKLGEWKEATRLCIAGKFESARDLFCGLSSKGLQPDVRTYTKMINGLCIGGLTSEAEKLLVEMEGKSCSPNGCTYNTIIRGLISNKETSRAMVLIQQMVEKGLSADASTTELIVQLLSKDEVDPALLPLIKESL
ncbi:hypothetical protein L3X38_031247 [Prunus dulcis]|uniref:Pentatricopeptide repeat superfamily protein n=1 Tax=Prunus dulcis TaxID=3755 RepID=A0AAD4VBV6_PRUDU|nr:hypothetical protein L3X38_031247 [Prunus dulcis]